MSNKSVLIALCLATMCGAASAEDKQVVTDAQKAKIKSQVESLQKAKLQQAETANSAIKEQAARQGKAIDKQTQQAKERVDRASDSYSWYYGSDAAHMAGTAKKHQIDQEAQVQKDNIAADAKRRAAAHTAAANAKVQTITQSVQGLKSQVAKKGEYGLQVQGSNLHVRNYGTK